MIYYIDDGVSLLVEKMEGSILLLDHHSNMMIHSIAS